MRWLWHERSLTTSWSVHLQQSLILPAPYHLEWDCAVCVTYGSVCRCSRQDRSPAVIQHSWSYCGASPIYHYPLQLCCKIPRSLHHIVWPSMCGEKSKTPSGRTHSLPPSCSRCLRPWKQHNETKACQSLSVPRTIRLCTAPVNQLR